MSKPPNIEALSPVELKALVVDLLGRGSAPGRVVAEHGTVTTPLAPRAFGTAVARKDHHRLDLQPRDVHSRS